MPCREVDPTPRSADSVHLGVVPTTSHIAGLRDRPCWRAEGERCVALLRGGHNQQDSEGGGMIDVQATEVIDRSPDDILGFVMDLDRYRTADHKILKVHSIRRDGNDAEVSFRSRARGLPALARQRMHLLPAQRIYVTNVP